MTEPGLNQPGQRNGAVTMEESEDFAPSSLRDYYDLLHDLSEEEQTVLAELHASKPNRVASRFGKSVELALGYPRIDNPIYGKLDSVTGEIVSDRTDLEALVGSEGISSTDHFAAHLAGSEWSIEGPGSLTFTYVDRELSPLRIDAEGGPRPSPRFLDLLLRSDDGLPIVAELKVGRDSLPYSALIQALMYASDLCGPAQFERMNQLLDDGAEPFVWNEGGPSMDIFVVFFEPDIERWTFWKRSLEATRKITAALNRDKRVNSVVRKISLVFGRMEDDQLILTEDI